MHRLVVVLAAMLLVVAGPAEAQRGPQTVDGIERAWSGWMARCDKRSGGLAVLHGGRVVREAVVGVVKPGESVPYASLARAASERAGRSEARDLSVELDASPGVAPMTERGRSRSARA